MIQMQINKLKKYNMVHENEFIIITHNQNFEKKYFEEINIPSFDEYLPSVDLDDECNLCLKSYDNCDLGELTVKPCQSNFEIDERIEKSKQEKIKNIIQNKFNFSFKSTSIQTKNEIDIKSENNTINIYLKEEKINKEKKNLGRKRKGDHEEREHTKLKDDNKIRKIKSHFTKFIYSYLNLKNKNKKLLKMKKCINEDLGKQFNVNYLMNMTLREMLIKFNKSNKGEAYISQLINEFFKYMDQKEINEKLNKTYIEVLKIMRDKYLDKFKADILTEELNRGENLKDANNYVNKLVKQLFEYEEWFTKKKGRKSKKVK